MSEPDDDGAKVWALDAGGRPLVWERDHELIGYVGDSYKLAKEVVRLAKLQAESARQIAKLRAARRADRRKP
jgi:hypothetical protein